MPEVEQRSAALAGAWRPDLGAIEREDPEQLRGVLPSITLATACANCRYRPDVHAAELPL